MLLGPNVDKNEITETSGNDMNVIAPILPGDAEEDLLKPETFSEFISKVIEIADKKDKIKLEYLCRNSKFDLHSRDGTRLNVTQQLASKGNNHVCFWLAEQGATVENLASGAAHGGHEDLTYKLIQFMEERQIPPNYNGIVKNAAYGGHEVLTEKLILVMKMKEIVPDYQGIVNLAAVGGHASLTWKLIRQMEEEKKAELNYQRIAEGAACSGLGSLIEELISIMEEKEIKADYQRIVNSVAGSYHGSLTWKFIRYMEEEKQAELNYQQITECAASGGHKNLTEELILAMEKKKINPDYQRIVNSAAAGGNESLTRKFIRHMEEEKKVELNYHQITERAARGGHRALAIDLIQYMKNKGIKPNCQEMANFAAAGGHENLTKELIRIMEEEKITPDYQKIANFAGRGGHEALTKKLIQLMENKEIKFDYQRIANFAAAGGHVTLTKELIRLMEINGIEPKCEKMANLAAFRGHETLTEGLIRLMENKQIAVNYQQLAIEAGQGGCEALTKKLIQLMEYKEIKFDYQGIANAVARAGHKRLTTEFIRFIEEEKKIELDWQLITQCTVAHGYETLTKELIRLMEEEKKITPNYQKIANLAGYSGHEALTKELIRFMKEEKKIKPDYQLIAEDVAYGGHELLTKELIRIMEEEKITPDYQQIANLAGRGGHEALTKKLIQFIEEEKKIKPDYQLIAEDVAYGGHEFLTKELIRIMEEEKITPDYQQIANLAGRGGHEALTKKLIQFIEEEKKIKPDYQLITEDAAYGGCEAFTKELIRFMEKEKQIKPDYQKIANFAAERGHGALVNELIKLIEEKEIKLNYQQIICHIARNGHRGLTSEFIRFMEEEKKVTVNYQQIIEAAAYGGHGVLVNELVNIMETKEIKPDYQRIANLAVSRGHETLTKELIRLMANNQIFVNYEKLSNDAGRGGHEALNKILLQLMEEKKEFTPGYQKKTKLATVDEYREPGMEIPDVLTVNSNISEWLTNTLRSFVKKNDTDNTTLFESFLKQHQKCLNINHFIAKDENGNSVLRLMAATAAYNKASHANYHGLLHWVITQYQGEFEAKDFVIETPQYPYKYFSILDILAMVASKGHPEPFNDVFKQIKHGVNIVQIIKQKMHGSYAGQHMLHVLAKAAAIGHPEPIHAVIEHFQDLLTAEHFTVKLLYGADKGKNVLWWLAKAASKGYCQPLNIVLDKFSNDFKVEDYISKAERRVNCRTSVGHFLTLAAKQGHVTLFRDIVARHPEAFDEVVFINSNSNCYPQRHAKLDLPPKPALPDTIDGGIADKYLRPENRTSLKAPAPLSLVGTVKQNQTEYFIECASLESIQAQSEQVLLTHKRRDLQVANSCQLSFYSQNHDVKKDVPCVFIMAGRNQKAHFLKPTDTVRTILVLSKENLNELTGSIPASLDYIVIENLHSQTHGEFKQDELGLPTSRRISAFLFAHLYEIDYCIVCDDNIAKISLSKAPESIDPSYIYNTLIEELKQSLSVNVQTIDHNRLIEKSRDYKLGSKLFAFNMRILRTVFQKAEDLFYLFPPSSCIRWWGEDYFMQCMLHEVAQPIQKQGFRTLTLEEFGGLYRLAQHKNSCKKVISTAEDWSEKGSIFLDGIDFFKIEEKFQSNIKNSFRNLAKIVEERLRDAEKHRKRLLTLDIVNAHASANNIKVKTCDNVNKRVFKDLDTRKAFLKGENKLESIKGVLYEHQFNALKILLASKEQTGHMAMCTGAGKTRVQIVLAHLCSTKMRHPLFIVAPTRELVQQTFDEFMKTQQLFSQLLDCALYQHEIIKVSSSPNDLSQGLLLEKHQYGQNVFIFCEDSFKQFMESNRYFNPGALIFDEFHDIAKETISNVIDKFPKNVVIPVIGLSATPINNDHPLSKRLFNYSREQALEDGRVTPIIIDTFQQEYSLEKYNKMLSLIPRILETTFHPNGELLYKKKGIIFVNSINDAKKLKKKIEKEIGIEAFAIYSEKNADDIGGFKKCDVAVAIAVQKLRVGFDDPKVNYVINLRNPNNADIFTQIVGRVMRIIPSASDKIGYALAFHKPNTSNFEITTDTAALEKSSDIYAKRQTILFKLKLYSFHLGNFVSEISNMIKEKTDDVVKRIFESRKYNKVLDSFDSECDKHFVDYKVLLKSIFKNNENISDEYQFFKSVDPLFLALKRLDKMLIPSNQHFYSNKEKYINDPEFVFNYQKSLGNIHKELLRLDGRELITNNSSIRRIFGK